MRELIMREEKREDGLSKMIPVRVLTRCKDCLACDMCLGWKYNKNPNGFCSHGVEVHNDIPHSIYVEQKPTMDAIPIEWIEKYIWSADTHEEKLALRKMYLAWEKENE